MHTQLRNRFILVSMLTVGLVLSALVGAINLVNYRSMYRRADFVTQLITEHGGVFPTNLSQSMSALQEYGLTAESPYSMRYFSVLSSPGRDIITTNRDNIVAITGEEIQALVIRVMTGEKTIGTTDHFRFRKTPLSNGTIYVFLDMSQSIKNFQDTLHISQLLLLATMIIVFFVIRFLSEKAVEPIIEVLDRQKLFINDAGHELKTPLAIIASATDVLELTEGENQWTGSIKKQVERMNHLIQDMLTLSRYDDLKRLSLNPVKLSRVVSAVSLEMKPLLEDRELTLRISQADDYTVLGNEESLITLFRTLLDNAIRYSAPGETITLASRRSGSHVLIDLTNPFPDFPEDQLEKIFERFYRADASRSRNTGGSGIGLAMARTIAQANGADIRAIKPSQDAITFQVRLRWKK